MTISKLYPLILMLLVRMPIMAQGKDSSIGLSVIKNNCVIKLYFINQTKRYLVLPNFLALSKDTSEGYKVLSKNYITIQGDTLVLTSGIVGKKYAHHTDIDSLMISDQRESPQVVAYTYGTRILRKSMQIFKLPTQFCDQHYFFCKIMVGKKTLIISKILYDEVVYTP